MTKEQELSRGLDMAGLYNCGESTKMFYFLSVFHPELSLEQRLELSNTQEMRVRCAYYEHRGYKQSRNLGRR